MSTNAKRSVMIGALVVAVGGCSSVGRVDDDGGADAGSNHGLATALAPAFCDHVVRCCANRSVDCVAAATEALRLFGDFGAELRAGGIHLDEQALARCRGELSQVPCDMPTEVLSLSSCRAAIVGHRKIGEACLSQLGCEAPLECVVGRCETVGGIGAPCDAGSSPLPVCSGGFCIAPGCSSGLLCLGGSCQQPAEFGESCSPDYLPCRPFAAACDCAQPATNCVDGGTCVPLKPLDAGCVVGRQCASRRCAANRCEPNPAFGDFQCQVSP